ncbi:hypothetical protein EJB05_28860, partial [Eragrostis curvula]
MMPPRWPASRGGGGGIESGGSGTSRRSRRLVLGLGMPLLKVESMSICSGFGVHRDRTGSVVPISAQTRTDKIRLAD